MGAVAELVDAVAELLEAVVPGRVAAYEPDDLTPPYVFVGRCTYDELKVWGGQYPVVVPVVVVADGIPRASSRWLYDTTEAVAAALVDVGLVFRSGTPGTVDAGGLADASGAAMRWPAQLLTFAAMVGPAGPTGPTPL
jgi:hypothetical protein